MLSEESTAVSPTRTRLSRGTIRSLDAFRAIAALAVVLQHARLELLVAPRLAAGSSILQDGLYWLTGFGHEAVVVFFVLSGALVGGSVVKSLSDRTWSWGEYLVRRMARLYVVLIPALVLVLVWDGAGALLFPGRGVYGDVLSAITLGGHTLIVHNRDVFAYAGNLSFLMTIFVPVLGSGGALWSLSNEFWYYILFPCLALAVAERRNSRRSLLYIAISFAIVLFVSHAIVEWMAVWLLGVAALKAPRLRLSPAGSRMLVAAASVLFLAVVSAERSIVNVISLGGDVSVGLAFSLLLYSMFCRDSSRAEDVGHARGAGAWARLAGFSYTLYLFHQPPLVFANAWLIHSRHSLLQPTITNVAVMLGAVLAVTLYAYAGSRLTEARTDELRRALKDLPARARFKPWRAPSSPRFVQTGTA
jgi:peptidoglycan/LPS O-acetylase OafA/YrhL